MERPSATPGLAEIAALEMEDIARAAHGAPRIHTDRIHRAAADMQRALLTAIRPDESPIGRPPIERYVRCSVTVGAWTVEPGIEWREGDDFETIARDLAMLADAIGRCGSSDPMRAAQRGEIAFAARWSGRAFFIEIHDTAGRWTQTYQPYGLPRFR